MDYGLLNSELEAITNGEHRTWGQISQLLLEVENSDYLLEEFSHRQLHHFERGQRAKSLTSWMKTFAQNSKINLSTLWRYLSSGRYYKQLVSLDCINKLPNTSVPLDQLSDNVSAESLEILAKISRVAPENEFIALAQKLLAGNVTRAELRDVWQAFRPVLNGRTARGQVYRAQTLVPAEIKLQPNYYEALACNALLTCTGNWVGEEDPKNRKVFFNIATNCLNPNKVHEFSAVVAVKSKRDVVLHGIEIITEINCELTESISFGTLLSDFLWIVTQNHILTVIEELIPTYVGILVIIESELYAVRPAQKSDKSGAQVNYLAKALLIKLL